MTEFCSPNIYGSLLKATILPPKKCSVMLSKYFCLGIYADIPWCFQNILGDGICSDKIDPGQFFPLCSVPCGEVFKKSDPKYRILHFLGNEWHIKKNEFWCEYFSNIWAPQFARQVRLSIMQDLVINSLRHHHLTKTTTADKKTPLL